MPVTDIRVMIPRVRRAVEGVGSPAVLSDGEVKDLIADALADIILYSGGVFGKQLVVTETGENGEPVEYATSDELTLAEQSIVAAQAALNHFFFTYANTKISERIADEAQTWEYALSANLIRDRLKFLVGERNSALEQLTSSTVSDSYQSFIAARDALTSSLIEPWVRDYVPCGQEDYRFGAS